MPCSQNRVRICKLPVSSSCLGTFYDPYSFSTLPIFTLSSNKYNLWKFNGMKNPISGKWLIWRLHKVGLDSDWIRQVLIYHLGYQVSLVVHQNYIVHQNYFVHQKYFVHQSYSVPPLPLAVVHWSFVVFPTSISFVPYKWLIWYSNRIIIIASYPTETQLEQVDVFPFLKTRCLCVLLQYLKLPLV